MEDGEERREEEEMKNEKKAPTTPQQHVESKEGDGEGFQEVVAAILETYGTASQTISSTAALLRILSVLGSASLLSADSRKSLKSQILKVSSNLLETLFFFLKIYSYFRGLRFISDVLLMFFSLMEISRASFKTLSLWHLSHLMIFALRPRNI